MGKNSGLFPNGTQGDIRGIVCRRGRKPRCTPVAFDLPRQSALRPTEVARHIWIETNDGGRLHVHREARAFIPPPSWNGRKWAHSDDAGSFEVCLEYTDTGGYGRAVNVSLMRADAVSIGSAAAFEVLGDGARNWFTGRRVA